MRKLLLLFASLLSIGVQAQFAEPFQLLDTNLVNSGIFIDQGPGMIKPFSRDGYSGDSTLSMAGRQLMLEFCRSQCTSSEWPSLAELRNKNIQFADSTGQVPIQILNVDYNFLLPNAIEEGLIDTTGGLYQHIEGTNENPFGKARCVAGFLYQDELSQGAHELVIHPDFIFSNRQIPEHWEMDLGNGFETVVPGHPFLVEIESTDLNIPFRFKDEGEWKKFSLFIAASPCSSEIQPDPTPWAMEDPAYPWRISAQWNGQTIYANAYVKYRADAEEPILSKPFIFVEGIDFNRTQLSSLGNGDFGWCEFITGTDPDYDFLYNMPNLVQSLRNEGYDIILLDFRDGAHYVQANTELLIKLLELVNEHKLGSEPNVLSGASMGGQITRYALARMEAEGLEHCTRLWISLDSPHKGASIPIGIQYMLRFLASDYNPSNAAAEEMLNNTLMRPAARQFLLQQLPEAQSLYYSYYPELESYGFPQLTRNVAIANGNGNGQIQDVNIFSPWINYDVEFLGNNVVWLRAFPAPGFFLPFQNQFLLFSGKIPTSMIQLPDFLGGSCIPNGYLQQSIMVDTPTVTPFEIVSGGTRPTILQMVQAMNDILAEGECGSDQITQYQSTHGFIPTLSALAMDFSDPFAAANEMLIEDPEACPFDAWLVAPSGNERHSEITDLTLQFVLDEVLGGEDALGPILNSNSLNQGVFNLCSPFKTYLRDHDINNGGKLYLNASMPAEFGDDPQQSSEPGSHLIFRTSGCGSRLEVGYGGELHIGDPEAVSTASLIVRANSTLSVLANARLIVHKNSELIIESGAQFEQFGASLILEEGARVIIADEATKLIAASPRWFLQGDGSRLEVSGQVQLHQGTHLRIHQDAEDAFVLLPDDLTITAGQNSILELRSEDPSSKVLHLSSGVTLSADEGLDRFRLRNAAIQMEAGAEIQLHARAYLRQASFFGPSAGAHFHTRHVINASEVFIEEVQLSTELSNWSSFRSTAEDCRFVGKQAGLRVVHGSYGVRNSVFEHGAWIYSTDLDEYAYVDRSEFGSDGPYQPTTIQELDDRAVLDESDQDLYVSECSFSHYRGSGVAKMGGQLYLSCTDLERNYCGIELIGGASLNAGEGDQEGGNYFFGNRFHVLLDQATDISIESGYNLFTGAYALNMAGTLAGSCTCETDLELDLSHNQWNAGPGVLPINPAMFDITVWNDCPSDPWAPDCPVDVFDTHPIGQVCSGTDIPEVDKALEVQETAELVCYPNPFTDKVWIELEEAASLTIYDLRGQVILSSQPGQGLQCIETLNWAPGAYLCELRLKDGQFIRQVLVHAGN